MPDFTSLGCSIQGNLTERAAIWSTFSWNACAERQLIRQKAAGGFVGKYPRHVRNVRLRQIPHRIERGFVARGIQLQVVHLRVQLCFLLNVNLAGFDGIREALRLRVRDCRWTALRHHLHLPSLRDMPRSGHRVGCSGPPRSVLEVSRSGPKWIEHGLCKQPTHSLLSGL
jgi:hypothetical protein